MADKIKVALILIAQNTLYSIERLGSIRGFTLTHPTGIKNIYLKLRRVMLIILTISGLYLKEVHRRKIRKRNKRLRLNMKLIKMSSFEGVYPWPNMRIDYAITK